MWSKTHTIEPLPVLNKSTNGAVLEIMGHPYLINYSIYSLYQESKPLLFTLIKNLQITNSILQHRMLFAFYHVNIRVE